MGLFDGFDPIGDLQRAGSSIGDAFSDTSRALDRATEDAGRALRDVAKIGTGDPREIGFVQDGFQPGGFQQLPEFERAKVPTLDELSFAADPPGSSPIPRSSNSNVPQRATVLTEAAVNAGLETLCKALDVLQKVTFHSGTSEHSVATLHPFQILIPRGINASSRNSVFCLLRIKSCSVEFDGTKLNLDGWQFAFEVHLEGLTIIPGDYSVERLFSVLLDNISTEFDSANTSVGLNTSNEPIFWSSWLKESKNKQFELPLRSFIERWVRKNISEEYNKFGFKFQLSEFPSTTGAENYSTHVKVFSPSTELGNNTDDANALLYYDILDKAVSPRILDDDFRKSLARQLSTKSTGCGVFGITGSSPVNHILQILADFSRDLNFSLSSSPLEVTIGNSTDPLLYVDKRNQEQSYTFQQTHRSFIPEERLRNGFMKGHLCAKFEMRATFSESRSRLSLVGNSPILYILYFGEEANFEYYSKGLNVVANTPFIMEFSLHPSPTVLAHKYKPEIHSSLLPKSLGEPFDQFYQREFINTFIGEDEFARRTAFLARSLGEISPKVENFPTEFKDKFKAPAKAQVSKWFNGEQMTTTDLTVDEDGYYTGVINSLKPRANIKITTIAATPSQSSSPATTAVPLTTSAGGLPIQRPAIDPAQPPTTNILTAQGKLHWELTSTSPRIESQNNKLTLIGRNTSASSLRFGYLKVKFTAGDEFSDSFSAQPILTDAISTPLESETAISVSSSTPQIVFSQPRLESSSSSQDGNWWTVTISPKTGEKFFMFPADTFLSFSFEGSLGAEGTQKIPIIETIVGDKGDVVYKSEDLQISFSIGAANA